MVNKNNAFVRVRVAILMNNYLGASRKVSQLGYTFQQILL